MAAPTLIAAAVIAPLGGAALILALRRSPNLREFASFISGAVLLVALLVLLPEVAGGERPTLTLFEVLPGVPIAFSIEPLGMGFALIVAFLWLLTVLYSIGYMRAHEESNQTRFYAFFAVAIAATIGGAFSDNLLTLYLFYEGLTLATYPLVTHGGQAKDQAGGRTYLRVLLGTSLTLLLFGLVSVYALTGTLTFTPGGILRDGEGLVDGLTPGLLTALYAVFIFGIGKAALMPFHRWLPAAMVAPTPVSALLHAVAVVKLGVFAVLKVSVYTFGLETLVEYAASWPVQYAAAATLLLAAIYAIRENNLKRRLAYSTVSQLAYIVLAASLANPLTIMAGGMHIAAHALAKITLFFCAGMVLVSLHKTTVSDLDGAGKAMPITMTAWIVASLCVIGMPLTGGFWSKWYLGQGALAAGEPLMLAVILLGSLLAMGYLLPPAVRAFYPASPGRQPETTRTQKPEAPRSSLAALTITAALSLLLFFAAQPMSRFLSSINP